MGRRKKLVSTGRMSERHVIKRYSSNTRVVEHSTSTLLYGSSERIYRNVGMYHVLRRTNTKVTSNVLELGQLRYQYIVLGTTVVREKSRNASEPTGPNAREGCHVTTCHNRMSKDISGTRLGVSERCDSQTWQLATKLVYQLLLPGIRCNQAVPFPMPVQTLSYSARYIAKRILCILQATGYMYCTVLWSSRTNA